MTAKVEKKDSGKETLQIAGKKYECDWIKYAATFTANGRTFEMEIKIWLNKTLPLSGLAKMESKASYGSTTMEESPRQGQSNL